MLKKALLGIAVACVLGACASPRDADDPEAVVTALFEAFNRHDVEAMLALYAADAVHATPASREGIGGRAEIRRNYVRLFENLPGVQDDVRRMVVDGDTVAIEFVGSWNGAGGRDELHIASFITVRGGKIVEDATYYDQVPLLLAAGAISRVAEPGE